MDVEHAVSIDAGGPRVSRHFGPDRGRPGAHDRGHLARGPPNRRSSDRTPSPSRSITRPARDPGDTSSSRVRHRRAAHRVPSAVTSTWPPPRRRSTSAARRSPSSSERTSSRSSSGGRPARLREQLRLREQQREHGHALLALRPVRAELALAGSDPDLVEVRARARRPPAHVTREPRLEHVRRHAARARSASTASARPSSPARSANGERESARSSIARADVKAAPASTSRAVHGSTASETAASLRDTAERRVPLGERRRRTPPTASRAPGACGRAPGRRRAAAPQGRP